MNLSNGLQTRNWTGYWIEPEQEPAFCEPDLTFEQMVEAEHSGDPSESHLKCAKHLRRTISLENEAGDLPVKAVIYASAHGVYDLYINGKKADGRLLAPETTNYDKFIWYQEYDVSELVSESSLVSLDAVLGDGWWIGRLGMAGSSCNYGDKLGFLLDLELTYPDGSQVVYGSDEQFLSCDSYIRYSDLYIGEMQDTTCADADYFFRKDGRNIAFEADNGCGYAGDEDSDREKELPLWTPCHATDTSRDHLVKQPMPGIQVVKEIPCVQYVETPNGDLVADFGQVTAGVVRMRVKADAETCITLEHGEVLDAEGNYYSNIKGLYKDQKDRFICRGGEQTLTPHFTYHGFRYVRISGIAKENILELTALAYGTPLPKLSGFETDSAMLNALQRAIENSTVSNMISVPTDCPQREKLGWTGDINIFTKTGAFLYDLRTFLGSWLYQVRMDQFENGEIPVVVPNHPCQEKMQRGMSGGTNSSAAWSDCIVFIPLRLYQIYGDISFLTDNFAAMEKWMAYVAEQAVDGLWIHRFHFGDWLIPSLRELPDGVMRGVGATADITGSCYYALSLEAMAKICRILAEQCPETSPSNAGTLPHKESLIDKETLLGKETLPEKETLLNKENLLEKAEAYEKQLQKVRAAIREAYVYEDGRVGVHAAEYRDASQQNADFHPNKTEGLLKSQSSLTETKEVSSQNSEGPAQKYEDLQLQGLYVIMLQSGAVTDPDVKPRMLARLVQMIREADDTLDCGFSSIGFLLDVLYENGYPDVAYRLLFNTKAPSWLYMVEHGATTIWENWRAIQEDGTVTDSSYNHYAYGCVGDFIYRHIGGIEAMEPGYQKVRIAPDFACGIRKSSCFHILPDPEPAFETEDSNPESASETESSNQDPTSVKDNSNQKTMSEMNLSKQRRISVNWKLDDSVDGANVVPEELHGLLEVEIPEGVSAIIKLPTEECTVTAGNWQYRF